MTTHVVEGTWEEITRQSKRFVGRKVRLFVLDDGDPAKPNQRALDVMQKVREKQKDMQFTSGEKSVDIVRRGRDGEMFNNDPE